MLRMFLSDNLLNGRGGIGVCVEFVVEESHSLAVALLERVMCILLVVLGLGEFKAHHLQSLMK